jgi:diacylglycerol kinase family enzyme
MCCFGVAGNSRWYGGGFKAAPRALPDDGLLDFIIVKKTMNRLKMLGLVGKYKAGSIWIGSLQSMCAAKK